jgi:phage portal protein BeeE
LTDRGMPSVAIITPTSEPNETDLDAAAEKWAERFTDPTPKPAFFPKDTQVIPLSWSPTDSQMAEARKITLLDLANLMNLDGYWLGVEGSSHTYKSPGPLFLTLLKTSLRPVMDPFEDEWSDAWFPDQSTRVRFDPTDLLRDDLGTMVQAFTTGTTLFPDPDEARIYMGFPPLPKAEDDEMTQAANSTATQAVGIPALLTAGLITVEEGRLMLGLTGPPPPTPAVEAPTDPPPEPVEAPVTPEEESEEA